MIFNITKMERKASSHFCCLTFSMLPSARSASPAERAGQWCDSAAPWGRGSHRTRAVPHLQGGVAGRGQLWDWPTVRSSIPWQVTMAHPSRGMLPSRQRTFLSHQELSFQAFPSVNDHNGHTAGETSRAQFFHVLCSSSPKPAPRPKHMPAW